MLNEKRKEGRDVPRGGEKRVIYFDKGEVITAQLHNITDNTPRTQNFRQAVKT